MKVNEWESDGKVIKTFCLSSCKFQSITLIAFHEFLETRSSSAIQEQECCENVWEFQLFVDGNEEFKLKDLAR